MMQHWAKYVVEVDVVSYFDTVNWAWLRKFVRHRVNDGGLIRLLNKWLKAGVMENGVVTLSALGVPQGGPVSPVLSNIYLHYVLDLWFERRFKKTCRGYAELTRFADDFVAAFRNQADARRFRQEMEERLAAFGLRVAPEKTALLGKRAYAVTRSADAADLSIAAMTSWRRTASAKFGTVCVPLSMSVAKAA